MNKSKKIILAIILGILCIVCSGKVQAALQANGGTPAVYAPNSWITGIRQMQTAGQALGLTDEIAGDLTSTNKNLDIHMQKNTEYGAMVILSASAYGKPDKVNNGETTTGNKTGVVMNINNEWVAAGTADTVIPSMQSAVGRYKNIYTTSYAEKVGDGVATMGAWHGASGNTWISSSHAWNENPGSYWARTCLIRSSGGSIFSYFGRSNNNQLYAPNTKIDGDDARRRDAAYYTKTWRTRAVVVVGSGI